MSKPKRSNRNRTLWGIKRPDGSVVQTVRAALTREDAATDFFDDTEEGFALVDEWCEASGYQWRGDLYELRKRGYRVVRVRVVEVEK